jgi:large subunit ribosomal protein L23
MKTILKTQVLSEKSTILSSKENKYTFLVHPSSNKVSIGRAVASAFSVKVSDVNVLATTQKPKKNRRTGKPGLVGGYYKKAVVTLQEGYKIEII